MEITNFGSIDFSSDDVWNVYVTPDIAKELLSNNRPDNRKWQESMSDKYAHDMEVGNWLDFAPDCVVLDIDGKVMSGQHRLHAIVKTGKTVGLKIMTGQPRESFQYIDGAKSRRVSDFIFEKNAKTRETATLAMFKMDNGVPFRAALSGGKGHATRQDALRYYSENTELVGYVAKQTVKLRNSLSCGQTRAFIVFSHCIMKVNGVDVLEEFVEAMTNPSTSFVFKFRENLIKRYSKKDSVPKASWMLGMLLQAIELYESDPSKYSLNKGDSYVTKYEKLFREVMNGGQDD